MEFPQTRLRRLRTTAPMRSLVRETHLHPGALIYPLFLCPGEGVRREVKSMPGVYNVSVDEAVKEAEQAASLGLGGLLLFGLPETKDEQGSGAYDAAGITQQGLRALKQSAAAKKLVLIADVCLCEYTSHGHCGVVRRDGDEFHVDNDATLDLLAKTAASLAEAGADIVAPSDMMDGRVAAIRGALEREGHQNVAIMAYAAKYASAFYGPFRDAVGSRGRLKGDKRGYQMDPANIEEALREVELDLAEGADFVMVKPGLPYLDVVARVKDAFGVPTFVYQVSGEYAMIEHAAAAGAADRDALILETLLAFKRAGASGVLTYHALDAARLIAG
jgi:porphobilinogen synthase